MELFFPLGMNAPNKQNTVQNEQNTVQNKQNTVLNY
jgi:hypothetical protein